MPPREALYPLDWLRIAEQDLVRVERILAINDPGAACQKITAFPMGERYPHVTDDELTDDDVRSSWVQILPLAQRIRVSVAQLNAQKAADQDHKGDE